MTKNLHDLAIEAGMTDLEYVNEMSRTYAILLSAALQLNEVEILTHTVKFTDHDLEITARRIPAKNVSVN
ncbi:MAG: hypothetical protein KBF68_04020 [Nitrosomonas sp.]|jgi:hypothetical protein|nr:hypothetical protein [Nitrosomonas sp.]MBP9100543.1 hypothetical protein [Nitrosomonas sp.]